MSRELTLDEIKSLLRVLSSRLESAGHNATFRLVGGAAMALSGRDRRVTQDIDASHSSAADVERVVHQIAGERDLDRDGLNSSAQAFIPVGASWVKVTLGEGHNAYIASPETLLAMKLNSARERDIEDLSFLVAKMGIEDPVEAAKIADDLYGDDDIAYSPLSREDAQIVASEAIGRARQKRL